MPEWEPPGYPRIPRLEGESEDDLSVATATKEGWLRDEIVVEEKVDGSNVALWFDDNRIEVAGRAGREAMDRGGQLGRLKAWANEQRRALSVLLVGTWVAYGEWLWLQHSLEYDQLPDLLIVLDLWHPCRGYAPADERDERVQDAALVAVPTLYRGPLGSIERLGALTAASRFRSGPAEGAVLRREHADGRFDRCKWLRPEFVRRADSDWAGARRLNTVAPNQVGRVG